MAFGTDLAEVRLRLQPIPNQAGGAGRNGRILRGHRVNGVLFPGRRFTFVVVKDQPVVGKVGIQLLEGVVTVRGHVHDVNIGKLPEAWVTEPPP